MPDVAFLAREVGQYGLSHDTVKFRHRARRRLQGLSSIEFQGLSTSVFDATAAVAFSASFLV
jgi:hypothetical protein